MATFPLNPTPTWFGGAPTLLTPLSIEVALHGCPITRRTRPFSLARDDAADSEWRARAHAEHGAMMSRWTTEFKQDKGIDYTPPPSERGSSLYWQLHGVVSCHFNRPEEASRSYREALRLAPGSKRLGPGFGQLALRALLPPPEHAAGRLKLRPQASASLGQSADGPR